MRKYNMVYADPPWALGVMEAAKLRAMPVADRLRENALLWLWTPIPSLKESISVLESWGFGYAHLLSWADLAVKVGPFWSRARCEHLLVGVRGTVDIANLLECNLFDRPAEEEAYHPEYFKDLAEFIAGRAFGEPAMLDVFGIYWQIRYPVYGKGDWDFWIA
jgi:N6-adenosine-specific RNA methylase IME4